MINKIFIIGSTMFLLGCSSQQTRQINELHEKISELESEVIEQSYRIDELESEIENTTSNLWNQESRISTLEIWSN